MKCEKCGGEKELPSLYYSSGNRGHYMGTCPHCKGTGIEPFPFKIPETEGEMNFKLLEAILSKFKNCYEFAAALGVSQAAVSFWISGKSLPLFSRLANICTILECKPRDIFSLEQIKAMQQGKHKGRSMK